MKRICTFVALLLCTFLCRDGHAHNGAVALAYPLDSITVDGDFADWPAELPWQTIARAEYGDQPDDANDFEASFRAGYDHDAVYIAVDVRDQSTVTDGTGNWKSQDGCSVYLDLGHAGADAAPIQFNFYGNGPPRDQDASGKLIASSCQRSGSHHRYEWRIDIKRITHQQFDLRPGRVIGLDINLNDKDGDESFSWIAWGKGTEKALSPDRLGDILLVASDAELGDLHGRIVSDSGAAPIHPQTVSLLGAEQASPLAVISNSSGTFNVRLPLGHYTASTISSGRSQHFQIQPGKAAHLELHSSAIAEHPTSVPLRKVIATVESTRAASLHSYSWADGLRWGNVVGIAQATDGSLWIAGDVGLAHFDGRSMTAFEEQDGRRLKCQAIAIDRQGNVWGGDELGIFRYHQESIVRYASAKGEIAGAVRQLTATADGSLWIRTDHGVSRFADDASTSIYVCGIGTNLSTMAIEAPSRVWLGTPDGLIRLEAEQVNGETKSWQETRFTSQDGLLSNNVHDLLVDSAGQLWIGTAGGLTRFDGTTFQSWTSLDGLSHDNVTALAQTDDGRMWIGTEKGVDEMWRGQFFPENKVASPHVMYVDQEQNVWIGDETLYRVNSNRPWHPWHSHPLSITSKLGPRRLMLSRDGVLWVGTPDGLVRCVKRPGNYFADCTIDRYSTADGLAGSTITALLEDSRGGIWVGSRGGASRFDGNRFLSITVDSGLSTGLVTALAEDNAGRIWMGTSEGITIYHPQEGLDDPSRVDAEASEDNRATLPGHLTYLSTMHGLRHNHVSSLLVDDDGSVWIGLVHRALCRWKDGAVEHFDRPGEVNCLLKTDDHKLFAGGADGLYQFAGTQWNHVAACGKSRVFGLAEGDRGHLWIATSSGLKVYDGFAAHTFKTDDAMRWSCWDVLWDASERSVLVAGQRIAVYSPRRHRPSVRISGVSADQEYGSVSEVTYLSSQQSVRFAFQGISFSTLADGMRYQYRLSGRDTDWKLTNQSQVAYGQLPPGDYTFEVAAIDRDLNYSAKPASVQLHVQRDHRQAALWSSLGCAVIAVAFLSITVVKRNRGIRRLNVELDQRVKDRTAKLQAETAENKRLHDQLLQAQKLDAVGTMASGIAHDFNNSLAVITGFAEVAKFRGAVTGDCIDHILTAAKQAAGTTKNLLTFSQESPGERVPRDFVQLVRDTTAFLRKMLPTSIELSTQWPDREAIWCSLDSVHIQQVMVNVAMNARDAMPHGGRMSISVGAHPALRGVALLSVSDNGCGMAADVRKRIFDPFFTTKSRGQGTGLGMAIVHGIIENHQGSIEIESSVGHGTTVSIALPQCQPQVSESDRDEPLVRGRGESVLVAEDHRDVQLMIVAQLESAGFEVLTADDGQQALDVLREHKAKIRVALLDIDLPVMDGNDCLKRISEIDPQLPTILMSGLSSVDPAKLETPFLRKPFDHRTLLATIGDALKSEPQSKPLLQTDPTALAAGVERDARQPSRPEASAYDSVEDSFASGQPEPLPRGRGVLVIDDDDLVRMSTKALLASKNVEVYLANGPQEAIAILQANVDRIGKVLLDWNLPQTDPESFLLELQRASPGVAVLVVSGDHSLQPHQIQAKGFARLLRKPVPSYELMDAVA